MISRKKLALLSATGVLAVSLAIGGSTYALFNSTATNGNNSFTAGSLKISSARDDIPMTGPMFYAKSTADSIGGLETGEWAPGDKNTRGLFLHNNGSLDATLTKFTAKPAGPNGGPVSSGAQYDQDMLFANNATVMIWSIEKYDPTGDRYLPLGIDKDMNPNDINNVMNGLNGAYKVYLQRNPNDSVTKKTEFAEILDGDGWSGYHLNFANAQFLDEINKLTASTNNVSFRVTKVTTVPLSTLVNGFMPAMPLGFRMDINSGQTALLAFTVNMNTSAGNDLQNIKPYFNFESQWAQVRNN
jgi:spore coat-associated protein N